MLGNIEATSHETIRVASGNAPVLLSSVIFFNKWVVPLIDKGRACARGLRSDKFSMAVPQHDVINRIFTYFYNEEARTGETFTRAFARTTSSRSKYIYIYIYIYIHSTANDNQINNGKRFVEKIIQLYFWRFNNLNRAKCPFNGLYDGKIYFGKQTLFFLI